MTAGRMTRRSLLVAAGGAVASGALAHPAHVLAGLAGPSTPALSGRWLGTVAAGQHTIELSRSADLLGVEWQVPADARLHIRFTDYDGRWSDWVSAGATAHGPDRQTMRSALIGEPVWTGGTRTVQLRASNPLGGVRMHLIDVSDGVGAHRAALAADRSPFAKLARSASLALATPSLQAGPGQPPIIARGAWARGLAHPRVAPEYAVVRLAFVHHTENPNGYLASEVPAMLRAIFLFHRDVRGWNDIGYNFVFDSFGRIFEARAGGIDEPVVGAHAGGYNLASTGVAVLGSFASQPISAPARLALQRLLAWKLSLHGAPAQGRVTVRVNPAGAVYSRFPANARVALPRIAGHRDADTTDCPGDALYRELRAIRTNVRRLAPRPVLATLALTRASPVPAPPLAPGGAPPATGTPPQAPAPPTGTAGISEGLAGRLAFLDGTPIAGASVQIQARSVARRGEAVAEQTLAQVQSDADGRWTLPGSVVPAAGAVSLRALYVGAAAGAGGPAGTGAAVSDQLVLTGATLTPAGVPAPTPATAPAPAT